MEPTPENIAIAANVLAAVAGLPFLVLLLRRLRAQRGPGPTVDGAWPNVSWGGHSGGLLCLVAFVAIEQAALYAVILPAQHSVVPEALRDTRPGLYWVAMSVAATLHWVIACGLILAWLLAIHGARPASLGLGRLRPRETVRVALPLLLASMPLVIASLELSATVENMLTGKPVEGHPITDSITKALPLWQGWQVAALWLLAGLVIPFFEELFFRGLVQTSLMRAGMPGLAIAASAGLFALAHVGVPVSVVPMVFLGLALGYAFYRTRSLAACVLMHSLFNLFNLALATFPRLLLAAPA